MLHVNDQQPNKRINGRLHLFYCYDCRGMYIHSVETCRECGWSEMEALDLDEKQMLTFERALVVLEGLPPMTPAQIVHRLMQAEVLNG